MERQAHDDCRLTCPHESKRLAEVEDANAEHSPGQFARAVLA